MSTDAHVMNGRNSQLRLLQRLEFQMLTHVLAICEKHNLTYYISGGTFLGAVRHQGFIPWDDDVDLALPREDYEKLIAVLPDELPAPLQVSTFRNQRGYHRLWAKVSDPRLLIKNGEGSSLASEPCWIDVFPLDGAPPPGVRRTLWKGKLLGIVPRT